MKQEIIDILNELIPGVDFEIETALVDSGVIDSLDIVSLIAELRNVYNVELGVVDLRPENFNSVDAIVSMLNEKLD